MDRQIRNACQTGNLEEVKKLIVKIDNDRNDMLKRARRSGELRSLHGLYDRISILNSACYYGQLEIVRYLVQNGTDVDAGESWAIRNAMSGKHVGTIIFLIQNGAAKHLDDILEWACQNGYIDVVKALVNRGIDVHIEEENALRWACHWGYFDIVKFLVEECDADIHLKNERLLCNAILQGQVKLTEYLIGRGAVVNSNVLHWLKESGRFEMVEPLINLGGVSKTHFNGKYLRYFEFRCGVKDRKARVIQKRWREYNQTPKRGVWV